MLDGNSLGAKGRRGRGGGGLFFIGAPNPQLRVWSGGRGGLGVGGAGGAGDGLAGEVVHEGWSDQSGSRPRPPVVPTLLSPPAAPAPPTPDRRPLRTPHQPPLPSPPLPSQLPPAKPSPDRICKVDALTASGPLVLPAAKCLICVPFGGERLDRSALCTRTAKKRGKGDGNGTLPGIPQAARRAICLSQRTRQRCFTKLHNHFWTIHAIIFWW